MGAIAKAVGVSRGTLYLYFETRESLLLALYLEQLHAWAGALDRALADPASDAELVRAFAASAHEDRVFLDLSSRLGSVIEHNVSQGELFAAKRTMRSVFAALGARVAAKASLTLPQAISVIVGLGALSIGADQLDAGPSFPPGAVPDDVAEVMALFDASAVFEAHGTALVAGVRAR